MSISHLMMATFHTMDHLNINQEMVTKQAIPNTWNTTQQLQKPKDILRQNIHENIKRKGKELPHIGNVRIKRRRTKQLKDGEVNDEILRRREKNRKAAMKCREKKRKTVETLQEKVDKYESSNKHIEKKIQNFQEEISKLKDLLGGHKCTKQPQHHFEQSIVNVNVNFQNLKTKASLGVVGRQEVPVLQPQPNSFKASWYDNDESQKHSIEQFLNELHEDDLWDNL